MHTTILKSVKGRVIEYLFDNASHLVNIKYYKANVPDNEYISSNVYNYEITIRHNEDQDAEKLFDDAVNKCFPTKPKKQKIFFVSTENTRVKGRISYYIAEIVPNKGLRLIDNDFTVSKQSHRGREIEAIHRLIELGEVKNCIDKKHGFINNKKKDFILITATSDHLTYINQF